MREPTLSVVDGPGAIPPGGREGYTFDKGDAVAITTPAPRFDAWRDLEEMLKRSEPPEGHFHTAELEDDNEPNGMVVIRDRAGNPTAWLSRAAFEGFLKAAGEFKPPAPKPPAFRPPARLNRHQRRAEAAKKRRGKLSAPDLFLCLPCGKGGEEKGKTPYVDRRECDYCGALCQNLLVPFGQLPEPGALPRGAFITAASAPPPRALSRQEREAQVRPPPEPRVKRNPFRAPIGERCGLKAECGGDCELVRGHAGAKHACMPDPATGAETCPA